MNPVIDALLTGLSGITASLLAVLGFMMVFVFSVYGVLKVYAYMSGKSSGDVAYKMGRIFGAEAHEQGYSDYKKRRAGYERKRQQNQRYAKRYEGRK